MPKGFIIIVVTYNGMPWIQKCLESCEDYSVIIIDNASTDNTVNFIEENYPSVEIHPQSENLGFGQANNLGIGYALEKDAEYVFLLNQDAYLHSGCIESLINNQKLNPDFGILSPIHLNGNGDRMDQNFSNYMTYKNNIDFYSDFVLNKDLKEIYEVPFVNAAGWLLSRDILKTVGGFDPIFFHYGEDDNYCQRARYHNFKIGVVPFAFLNHDREGREPRTNSSVDYLINRERSLKHKYADINLEDTKELEDLLRKRKRAFIKLFLKLKFSKLLIARQEIDVISKVIQEVILSRDKNQIKGMHYL